MVTIHGERLTAEQELLMLKRGITPELVRLRVGRGMSVHEAINKPVTNAKPNTRDGYLKRAAELGISHRLVKQRLNYGWDIVEATHIPPREHRDTHDNRYMIAEIKRKEKMGGES